MFICIFLMCTWSTWDERKLNSSRKDFKYSKLDIFFNSSNAECEINMEQLHCHVILKSYIYMNHRVNTSITWQGINKTSTHLLVRLEYRITGRHAVGFAALFLKLRMLFESLYFAEIIWNQLNLHQSSPISWQQCGTVTHTSWTQMHRQLRTLWGQTVSGPSCSCRSRWEKYQSRFQCCSRSQLPAWWYIWHLLQHPGAQPDGLSVLIRSTHQQTPSFLNGSLVSENWEAADVWDFISLLSLHAVRPVWRRWRQNLTI